MKLSQLKYFIAVCECEKITEASKKLFVSQPTITVAIKELEEELGVTLFQRVKQRIFLTKEGSLFYTEVKAMLNHLDIACDRVKKLAENKQVIKIGVPPMIGSFLFPSIFDTFIKENPNIHIDILELGTLKLKDLLLSEELDIIISVDDNKDSKYIAKKPLIDSYFAFFVSNDHLWTKKDLLKLNELGDEPLVFFNKEFVLNNQVREFLQNAGIEHPNVILETSQLETVKRFISQGIASGFLIKDCVSDNDNIVEVRLDTLLKVNICAQWKSDSLLSNGVTSFIRFLDNNY